MSIVRKSLTLSVTETHLVLIIQFGTSLVLARLLTPEQIGVYSLAAGIVIWASVVRDFGVAEYLIQCRVLGRDQLRAAFTVQLAVSWLLACVILSVAETIALLYKEPGLMEVLEVQACNLFLIPFGAITMAYFQRQLNYRPIAIAGLTSTVVASSIALYLAHGGQGYMSLAWSSLAGVSTTVAMAMLFRPAEVVLVPGWRGIRHVLSFGTFASMIYAIDEAVRHFPGIAVGKTIGMEAVGLLSRAFGTIELFNSSVGQVGARIALPYFSLQERDGKGVRKGFLTQVAYISALGWPFCVFLGLFATETVLILFGDQWERAIDLAQILCLSLAINIVVANARDVYVALGQIKQGARLAAQCAGARMLCVLLGVPYGLKGVCVSLVVSSVLCVLITVRALKATIGITFTDLARTSGRSALVALLTFVPSVFIASDTLALGDRWIKFGLAIAVMVVAWSAAVYITRHPILADILGVFSSFRGALQASRASPSAIDPSRDPRDRGNGGH